MATIQALNNVNENHFLLSLVEKLYLQPEAADVYFVFGDDDNCERIPAHKCLLTAGSDVFKAMFYGELREMHDVEITDAPPEAFKEFLQFFYRIKVDLTLENAFDVVNLCKKYDMVACQKMCERFMKEDLTLTYDSVCSVYGPAVLFDMEDLIGRCERKIVANTKAVFESPGFLTCDRKVLSRILKLDELSCSEVGVFHACMNWVKATAQREAIIKETDELEKIMVDMYLGDLFYEIRFKSITLEEFAELTIAYGNLFTLEEYQEIVQLIGLKNFQSELFKNVRRRVHVPAWSDDAMIICNRYIFSKNQSAVFKTVENTTFTTNEAILLTEIACSGLKYANNDGLPAEMTICEIATDGTTKILYHDKNILFLYSFFMNVELTTPILIKPGFKYDIQFKHSSKKQIEHHGLRLHDKVQLRGSDVVIEFIGENNECGIVYRLIFKPIPKA